MGYRYTNFVWEADLIPTEKLVLLLIADHVNDEGKGCYASYDTITRKTGLDRSTVIRIVKKLKNNGILVHEETHPQYKTNVWMINEKRITPLPSRQEWLKEKRAANPAYDVDEYTVLEGGRTTPLEGVAPRHPQGSHHATPRGGTTPPNPLVEPLDEPLDRIHPVTSDVDKSSGNGAANLDKYQHNRDEEYERVPAGEEESTGTRNGRVKPRTHLEKLICQRTQSLYLSDPMRRKLNARVAAFVGIQDRWYPSPEEEMQNHTEAFTQYVNERANMYIKHVGRPPSRQNLVDAVANYKGNTEGKHGWLDFKARWDAGKVVGQRAIERPSPNGNGAIKDIMWFEE